MTTYVPFLGPLLALLAGLSIYAVARLTWAPEPQRTLDETPGAVEDGHRRKPAAP